MKIAISLYFFYAGVALALAMPMSEFDATFDINIIGGEDAEKGEFPYQVSLQLNGRHICGGSILDATHIVCAAHCLKDMPVDQMEIVAGGHNITNTEEASQQRIPVERLIIHEKFIGEIIIVNDVGVIVVSKPIEFNEFAQPIEICDEEPTQGNTVVNTGWGNAHPEGGEPVVLPDILQKVSLSIITRLTCGYSYPFLIRPSMVCAKGDPFTGACNGDSGGPLVHKRAGTDKNCLAGIVSFGRQPCGVSPSVYTGATYFKDWIAGAIAA